METMITCVNADCPDVGVDKGPIWMRDGEQAVCGACGQATDRRPATPDEIPDRGTGWPAPA